jgi:hypothetical protein
MIFGPPSMSVLLLSPSHLGTSFSRTTSSQDHGHQHLLVYVDDDFPPLVLQAHAFFQDFSGTSLSPRETQRRHRVLLTAHRRGMQKEYGGELFKDWRFFLVRAGFK